MNKIGFQIYRFKDGPSKPLTVNEGDWTRKVIDVREILKLYNLEDKEKHVAMFMSFTEYGAYITLVRHIDGRGTDNVAGWIYIPNNIEVKDDEIINIVDIVRQEITALRLDQERLESLFSKEYPSMNMIENFPSSSEKVYAKRIVGFYPLHTIIGKNRYQSYYTKYNTILIEEEGGLDIIDKNVIDITNDPIKETFVFCPPLKLDIPEGVSVHLDEPGEPLFNKPIRVDKSQYVKLLFKRAGFEDIPYMTSVEENGQVCEVPSFDWKITISKNLFKVRAAYNTEIDLTQEARITVNGTELNWKNKLLLREKDAINVMVKAYVNGFNEYACQANLLNSPKPILLEMHRAIKSNTWSVELYNGREAEMTLKSKYLARDFSNSPLKGYDIVEGTSNKLEYSRTGIFKQRLIGFMTAIVLGILVFLGISLRNWYVDHTFTWQFGWPILKIEMVQKENVSQSNSGESETTNGNDDSGNDETIPNDIHSLAIAYLDNESGKWEKDSLNHNSELIGLFDELNSFDFHKIRARYSSLSQSKRFTEVYIAINSNSNKSFNSNFCGDGDYTITVSKYIDKLNKPVDQSPNPALGGVASDAAKKTQATGGRSSKKKQVKEDVQAKVENKKNKNGSVM